MGHHFQLLFKADRKISAYKAMLLKGRAGDLFFKKALKIVMYVYCNHMP